jgi:MinD superfamily P-loop ATPase
MGSGTSGKLVTEVKRRLKDEAKEAEFAIIDGSPGIGCPVLASISGVDFVLIVAEPSISGLHDMKRILQTAKGLGARCAVCINKYDVNYDMANEIEAFCERVSVPVLGKIPYDRTVLEAVNACQTMAQYPDSKAGSAIAAIWDKINNHFKGETIHENCSCK